MQRRTLLATIGSTLVVGAGCVSVSNGEDGDPATTPAGTDTPTASDPGEGDGAGASFEDVPCPSFLDDVDRTVCTHTAGSDAVVSLTVSQQVFTPTTDDDSVETMEFTLHNDSDTPFGLNPYAWELRRQTDDGWTHVAPDEYIEPWYTLEPGGTYTWELGVESHPTPQQERTVSLTADIDSGTYAFQTSGFLDEPQAGETPADDDSEKTHVECIALFEVSRS